MKSYYTSSAVTCGGEYGHQSRYLSYYFIQIPYFLFKSYVHHVAADKLVNIPRQKVASSVEDDLWLSVHN